jgi:hypothetical protein
MNTRFICLRIQLDTTSKDNDTIRAQYQDAHDLMERYQVGSFPTYLFFASDGHIVHRAMGASADPEGFLGSARAALDSNAQYYNLLEKYNRGGRDSALLMNLAAMAKSLGDSASAWLIAGDYLDRLKDPYNKDNLLFAAKISRGKKDRLFELWLKRSALVDLVMGKDYAEKKVMNIIMSDDPNVQAANRRAVEGLHVLGYIGDQAMYDTPVKNAPQPETQDWMSVYTGIERTYGTYYGDRITKWVKMAYYNRRKEWPQYVRSVIGYTKLYMSTLQPNQLNRFAWDVFTYGRMKRELIAALSWSRRTLRTKDEQVWAYYDTYASLLYKLRQPQRAIAQEEMAFSLAPEKERPAVRETLEKMKNGVKTWD